MCIRVMTRLVYIDKTRCVITICVQSIAKKREEAERIKNCPTSGNKTILANKPNHFLFGIC